jgi:hypothetical protein
MHAHAEASVAVWFAFCGVSQSLWQLPDRTDVFRNPLWEGPRNRRLQTSAQEGRRSWVLTARLNFRPRPTG